MIKLTCFADRFALCNLGLGICPELSSKLWLQSWKLCSLAIRIIVIVTLRPICDPLITEEVIQATKQSTQCITIVKCTYPFNSCISVLHIPLLDYGMMFLRNFEYLILHPHSARKWKLTFWNNIPSEIVFTDSMMMTLIFPWLLVFGYGSVLCGLIFVQQH